MSRPKKNQNVEQQKESAQQLIQTVRRRTKAKYAAEDKIRIILEGLRAITPVAELCRREGISRQRVLRVAEGVHGKRGSHG